MKKQKNRGIVLLEILMAIGIFSVGVVFLVQSLATLVRHERRVRQQTMASILAENILDRVFSGELNETRPAAANGIVWEWESARLTEQLRIYTVRIQEHANPGTPLMTLEGVFLPLAGQ